MAADDAHEWYSFELDGSTWVFDLTFLTSSWTCIFGNGCLGIYPEPREDLMQGCCSYGAHFTGKKDRKRVERAIARLTPEHWQHHASADALGGAIHKNAEGETVTRTVDGACIFANRPDFAGGAGCALHRAALDAGERPIDWKPEVCWQLPLRLDHHKDDNGYLTYTLREWKRRDWGEGGREFHWWCTETHEAFVGGQPTYEYLRDEIVELVGEGPYDELVRYLKGRDGEQLLPHPAVRRRR